MSCIGIYRICSMTRYRNLHIFQRHSCYMFPKTWHIHSHTLCCMFFHTIPQIFQLDNVRYNSPFPCHSPVDTSYIHCCTCLRRILFCTHMCRPPSHWCMRFVRNWHCTIGNSQVRNVWKCILKSLCVFYIIKTPNMLYSQINYEKSMSFTTILIESRKYKSMTPIILYTNYCTYYWIEGVFHPV